MEQLFAVRVLVHYYDKPKVDHAAVRKLLSAVDTLQLLLIDGTSTPISTYIQTDRLLRIPIADVLGPSDTSLVQVASVFMLAEARAAADALRSSPADLETACVNLERLLACLATTRPILPVHDIHQSARVKLGTAARRRAIIRTSSHPASAADHFHQAPILKAVNAVLRLCDVATHCLAVVARQTIAPRHICNTAVTLSTRLLTLAASLYDVQRRDPNPALSFSSSNSLRTALVSGAMYLGSIAIEHLDIEPMNWVHVANHIVISSTTSVPPRTSIMSALFAGMIKSAKDYEACDRDTMAARRAAMLLSTLHVVLETDMSRDSRDRPRDLDHHHASASDASSSAARAPQGAVGADSGSVSQAARSFLGERVVAAEEDGDEARIAARTVYQACEEYAVRAGETEGVMGLLARLFASAGRQCRQEPVDETPVSISESPLNIPCPPDESDASSDSPHVRSEGQPFPIDVFDQRSRDGLATSPTAGTVPEDSLEPVERLQLHRQIGALALETLAHWVERTHLIHTYADLDIAKFGTKICASAGMFSLTESPESYDMRAAMTDFGSLIGITIENRLSELPSDARAAKWRTIIIDLISTCQRVNPILNGIIGCCRSPQVVASLLKVFFASDKATDGDSAKDSLSSGGLPVGSVLSMLFGAINRENAFLAVESIALYLKERRGDKALSPDAVSQRAACLMLLSHAAFVHIGLNDMADTTRSAIASLYHTDVESHEAPVYPPKGVLSESCHFAQLKSSESSDVLRKLVSSLEMVPQIIGDLCSASSAVFSSLDHESKNEIVEPNDDQLLDMPKSRKLLYHFLWSILMTERVVETLEISARFRFQRAKVGLVGARSPPLISYFCLEAASAPSVRDQAMSLLQNRKRPSAHYLYISECLSLLFMRGSASGSWDLVQLLKCTVKNVSDITAGLVMREVSQNFRSLLHALQEGLPCEPSSATTGRYLSTRGMFAAKDGSASRIACLQLAMVYIRVMGGDCLNGLLTDALRTSTTLVDSIPAKRLVVEKDIIFSLLSYLVFIPSAFNDLADAIVSLSERVLSSCFPHLTESSDQTKSVIAFISQVCGFASLVRVDSKSANGIQSLCKFASGTVTESESELPALKFSLGSGEVPESFGSEVVNWLAKSLPRVKLPSMLAPLLVPADDSAVAVSSHAQSLSLLTNSCELSECWRTCAFSGITEIFLAPNSDFAIQMVRRSVMQSATMNEGVFAMFEKIVGFHSSAEAAEVLLKCFNAAYELYEESDVPLESRVRLFSFCIRISIAYGKVSLQLEDKLTPAILEPKLFELLFRSLEVKRPSTALIGNSNEAQLVLFLCNVLDALLSGLYEQYTSFYGNVRSPGLGEAHSVLSPLDGNIHGEETGTIDPVEHQTSIDEQETQSRCTYTTTGNQYVEQHWYYCYSCALDGSEGVCSVCARVCHKGCELTYSKFSRFFCDCGAGCDPRLEARSNPLTEEGNAPNDVQHAIHQKSRPTRPKEPKPCLCMKPAKRSEIKPAVKSKPLSGRRSPQSLDTQERDSLLSPSLRKTLVHELSSLRASDASANSQERYRLITEALTKASGRRASAENLLQTSLNLLRENATMDMPPAGSVRPTSSSPSVDTTSKESSDGQVNVSTKMARSTKLFKCTSTGSTGLTSVLKLSGPSSSLIAYSSFKGIAAVATRSGDIELSDLNFLSSGSESPYEKAISSFLGKISVSFSPRHVTFHPDSPNALLVVGDNDLAVGTKSSGSSERQKWVFSSVAVEQTQLELFGEASALVEVFWVQGSASLVAVVTEQRVMVFDVSVSGDISLPVFFAHLPSGSGERGRTKIVSAAVWGDLSQPASTENFFMLILTSDGSLSASYTPLNGGCIELDHVVALPSHAKENQSAMFSTMTFLRYFSAALISFSDGSLLMVRFLLRGLESSIEFSVQSVVRYKEAVLSGPGTKLLWVPGTLGTFLSYQINHDLNSCILLSVQPNYQLHVQNITGNGSSSVVGASTYAETTSLGQSVPCGALLLLDDGSIHKVETNDYQGRGKLSEQSSISSVLERQRLRAMKICQAQNEMQVGYCPVPEAIGFFEKSRLVSEPITIEGPRLESGITHERMAVIIAGEGGDCVVSQVSNEPFIFTASISNQSLVLVGARLRVGGTDRSRNRVPAEVRVFDRTVSWHGRNGLKRWIDIPFSVPESTTSPQRVKIELFPHRNSERGRSVPDGRVAVDCLELHAVSTIEFTERKLLFEKESATHMEKLKKKKELSKREKRNRYPILSSAICPGVDGLEHHKFTQEQASALTAVSAVQKENFVTMPSAGELLFEANFLWVGSMDGAGVWDPRFLGCLLKACLGIEPETSIAEQPVLPDVSERVALLYQTARDTATASVSNTLENGMHPSISAVEKGLFSLGGMARSLLQYGRRQDVDEETWLEMCDKYFPSNELVFSMLSVHSRIGRSGRLLYRSLEHACTSAADVALLVCLIRFFRKPDDKRVDGPCALLYQMLCNVDQRLRLLTAQRVIDLFDSVDTTTEFIGSPFEDYMTSILVESFTPPEVSEEEQVPSEADIIDDESDGTARWAYRCDGCGKVCDGEWWHCMDCEDFDLCTECLRTGKRGVRLTHNEGCTLLRGAIEDEVVDPVDMESPAVLTTVCVSMQGLFAPLADSVLKGMVAESNTHWRFLDSVELLAQLVGPKSTPELREPRVEALSTSSIWTVTLGLMQKIEEHVTSGGARRNSQSFVQACASFCLILKIFLSGRGSSMPVHLHTNSLPLSILRLIQKMRGLLADVCERVSLERNVGVRFSNDTGILSAAVWNDNISGLLYDVLSVGLDNNPTTTGYRVFQVAADLPVVEVAVLNVVSDSLRVLEFAYRSVWSSAIVKEMQSLPQALLCDIINMCETASLKVDDSAIFNNVSSASRALLCTVSFGSDDALNNILDMYLYEDQSKKLQIILEDLPAGDFNVSYDVAVEVADIMENLHKAALAHPSTWREYVISNPSVVQWLLRFAKCFEGSVQVQMLQLLGAGLSVSVQFSSRVLRGHPFLEFELAIPVSSIKPDDDGSGRVDILSESTISKKSVSCSDLLSFCQEESQVSMDVISRNDFALLVFLVRHVLLKSQTKKARRAASQAFVFAIARGAAEPADENVVNAIDGTLSSGLEWMQFAGDLADGLMVCFRTFIACCHQNLLGASGDSRLAALTAKITSFLKDRCRLLVSHPNARLYTRLAEIIDLPGYFLESEPCITCATSTWESSEFRDSRLDSIRAETKYTDCSIMYRLVAVHEVQTVVVKIIDPRRTRRVKKIDVLYSAKSIADGADLKSSEHPWKKLKTINLGPNAVEGSISMTIPVVAANIKLHFVDFHSPDSENPSISLDDTSTSSMIAGSRQGNTSRATDSLQCPRCSRTVTDRHGICRNCHENAYQCRQCRNINYENLDGFLCNECGYCKHGRFEFSVLGRPTHSVETIKNEEDRKRASKMIERETSNVHRCMEQLVKLRSSIIKSLTLGIPSEDFREKSKVLSSTRVGLADLLDSVNPRSEIAVLEALLEGQVSHEMDDASPSQHGGVNLPDVVLGESQMNLDGNDREHSLRSGSSITSPIGRAGRADPIPKSQGPEPSNVNRRTIALTSTYAKECRTIFATMSRGVRILTMTRAELVRYANTVGGDRLSYADEFFANEEDAETANEPSAPELDDVLDKLRGLGTGTVCCYGCTQAFISKCVRLIKTISKQDGPASHVIKESNLSKDMLVVSSLCEKRGVRDDIRDLLTYLVNDNTHATQVICKELQRKIGFCIDSYDTVDSHSVARFEMSILEATALLDDSCWEDRLRLVIRILFQASTHALTCSTVAENIILPCLRITLRLLRFDSELTVIESTSEVGNNVLDTVISEGLPEPSETEQEDGQGTVDTASLTHSDTIPQDIVRPRISEAISSGALGDLQDVTLGNLGSNQGLIGFRDPTRADDRRSSHRVGSDLMVGSRAPSSIGTAFDGHMSDEDMEVSSDRTDQLISINAVNSIMENDHDAKRVSANIGMWLDGRHNQVSWVNELAERSKTAEDREKAPSLDGSSVSLQKGIFQKWKRLTAASNNRELSDEDHQPQEPLLHNLSIKKGNWIIRLMLFTPCAAVRKEACSLLEHLCCHEEALQLQLLDLLTGPSLSLGADVGDMSKEFFDLLESTLSVKAHRLYLIGRGFLPRLAAVIRTRAERLIQCEVEVESSMRLVNFTEGYSLKRLVALLRLTLEVAPLKRISIRQKLLEGSSDKVVWSLQRAYICVKKLISLRTRLTDECASQLSEVLLSKEFLFSAPTVDSIVSACVSELQTAHRRNDAQAVGILLEELCLMLCPERSEPTCLLSLNKAPTQEEFIRGSMSRNPYPSSSFDGPLMRHVKNKICKDLDLPGLLQDDFTMELLVAGNVVKMDLPIMGVYEHIWRGSAAASMAAAIPPPHVSRTFGLRRTGQTGGSRGNGGSRGDGLRGTILSFRRVNSDRDNADNGNRSESRSDPPMVVVYRLSGLDGEATEPIIDTLPSQTNDDQDAEDLYGDTIVLGEVGGFDVLFQLLAVVGSWGDDAETAVRAPALRLLRCSCEVAQNRTLLAKSPNAVSTLLDCAALAFEHAKGSPAAVSSAESLLIAAEQILAQQRRELDKRIESIHDSVQVSSDDPAEVMSRVQTFLRQLEVATSPKAEYSILHLLPFLIQGIHGAIDAVLKKLLFDWDDLSVVPDEQRKAKQLATVLFATPQDIRGNAFVAETIRGGVASRAVQFVINKFPMPKRDNREMWEAAYEEESVPLVLRLLTGLCQFFGTPSEVSDLLRTIIESSDTIVPVLCQLELAVSGNAIGTSAEEVVEAMVRDDQLKARIDSERKSIVQARREAAEASRLAILQETGLSASIERGGDETAQVNVGDNSLLQMMDELPEEDGPECVVCGDGFNCRPEEALALYVFCRKMPLDLAAKGSGQSGGGDSSSGNNSSGSGGPGGGRLDWDLWASGRSRGGIGGSSRSGTNSCYTTVTHMNAIHPSCHRDAARMDRSSRRDEWDGAALRNSQTKCNNLLPIRPPVTLRDKKGDDSTARAAAVSFASASDAYFARLGALGRVSLSQPKTALYDLGRGLLRFGDGRTAVFSEHSRGGGAHSNATLIPHMVQLALFVIEERSEARDGVELATLRTGLAGYLSGDEGGDVTFYLGASVLLQTVREWVDSAGEFARRVLLDKGVERGQALRLIAFADAVQRTLKKGMRVADGQSFTDALRRHIGSDETFAQTFGDEVNGCWERDIRGIKTGEEMVAAVRRNAEAAQCAGAGAGVDEMMVDALKKALEEV